MDISIPSTLVIFKCIIFIFGLVGLSLSIVARVDSPVRIDLDNDTHGRERSHKFTEFVISQDIFLYILIGALLFNILSIISKIYEAPIHGIIGILTLGISILYIYAVISLGIYLGCSTEQPNVLIEANNSTLELMEDNVAECVNDHKPYIDNICNCIIRIYLKFIENISCAAFGVFFAVLNIGTAVSLVISN